MAETGVLLILANQPVSAHAKTQREATCHTKALVALPHPPQCHQTSKQRVNQETHVKGGRWFISYEALFLRRTQIWFLEPLLGSS